MSNLDIIYDVIIVVLWDELNTNKEVIYLLPYQVSFHSMHSTSVYGLKLLVLRGAGAKALAFFLAFSLQLSWSFSAGP